MSLLLLLHSDTTLYQRNTTLNGQTRGGAALLDLLTVAGTSVDTAVTNTTVAGTEIPLTKTAGGSPAGWITPPFATAVTITGADIATWFSESSDLINVGGRFRLYRWRAGVETEFVGSPADDGVEFTTVAALYTWAATLTPLDFIIDDRLLLIPALINVGVMTMGTATLRFNGGAFTSAVTPTSLNASNFINNSGHTSISVSITVTTETYLSINVMWHHFAAPPTITGVTVNAVAASAVAGTSTTLDNRMQAWEFVAPPAGTYSVIVSYSGTTSDSVLSVRGFTGVNQSTPSEGGFNAGVIPASGSVKTIAPTTTTVANNYLIGGYLNAGASGADVSTVDTQVVEYYDTNNGAIFNIAEQACVGSIDTLGWTDTGLFNGAGYVYVIKGSSVTADSHLNVYPALEFKAEAGGVNASYTSSYTVRNYVSSAYSSSFSVRNGAGSSYASAFSVRNYTSASYSSAFKVSNYVSATYSSAFSLRNYVSGTYATGFSVRNSVGSSFASAFKVSNYVSATYSSAFSVSGTAYVSGSYSSAFRVSNYANASYSSAFSLRNYVSATYATAFRVLNSVGSSYGSAFSVRNYTSASYNSSYTVRNYVSTIYATGFTVRNFVAASYSSAFRVINIGNVSGNYASGFSVRNYVAATYTSGFSVNFIEGRLKQAIKEAYASAPTSVIVIDTLEFRHPNFKDVLGVPTAIRLVLGHSNLEAKLEADAPQNAGEYVTFIAMAFDLELPNVEHLAQPEIGISLDNVSRDIEDNLMLAAASPYPVEVTYRPYLNTDLTEPQMNPPITMTLISAEADDFRVTARASYGNAANVLCPRETYNVARFPGLQR